MPKTLTSKELQEELPTLCQSITAFAEALEVLDLGEVMQYVTDPIVRDILLAAQNFKSEMKPVLERKVGLH